MKNRTLIGWALLALVATPALASPASDKLRASVRSWREANERKLITDYSAFCKDILTSIKDKPLSIEVFSDDFAEMRSQALQISSWGENVFVKIPVTNTLGISTTPVIRYLTALGVKVNVTAIMTTSQVQSTVEALNPQYESYISVFAGRIADTGRDPVPAMKESLKIISSNQNAKLIWASPRELLNVFQANEIGCHIITATNDILKKLELVGKDLEEYSLETVKMFYDDATKSKFSI
jgi:transaldolase